MTRHRFLLDENLGHALRDGLLRRDCRIEVRHIGGQDAPPKGTPDPDILLWLEEHGFCLVTNNRASMPGHLSDHLWRGRHVLGLFALRERTTVGMVIEELLLIWYAAEPGEYADRITYIPEEPRSV